jgi:hypothetical protein
MLIIICSIIIVFVFFYYQAVCEFRFNQIEWSQNDKLSGLFPENVPIIIRNIPTATFWTHTDITIRDCYKSLTVFNDRSLTDWIQTATSESLCPYTYSHAEAIATVSGIAIWAMKWIHPFIPYRYWYFPKYHCWAGNVGLRKMSAVWTCLFPTSGTIRVSVMPRSMGTYLPPNWSGAFPFMFSSKDTPFVSDLNYIDIIVRPGSCLFIPAHWFASWCNVDEGKCAMTCTISYHSPISIIF